MFRSFRQSMAWLHTWFGLVLGLVLMAAFFFGALSVFDREIDRWAIPATRIAPQPMPSFEQVLQPAFARMQPKAEAIDEIRPRVDGAMPAHFDIIDTLSAYTTHRDPVLALYAGYRIPNARDPDELLWVDATIDPRDGTALPDDRLKIGSDFFYPMHYGLTLDWKDLGIWIVGFSALAMLTALVSGVIIHRKLFREFFTFRPRKGGLRSVLDLHNLTGVMALPFHFFFAFTGLLIFASAYYFPMGHTQLHALHDLSEQAESRASGLPHERAGIPAGLAPVDAMVSEARRRWQARGMRGEVGLLTLRHVGDANGYVSIYRAGTDRVALVGEGVHFEASTGRVIGEDPPVTSVGRISQFLTGLHLQHFRHWPLRWLYLFGGLAGAVCIATGFIFFVDKRKRQHARESRYGAYLVDALAVATVTGMVLATLGILVANRLLPESVPARGGWERVAFWGAWLLALLHAAWRSAPVARGMPNPAWRAQSQAIGGLALTAVALNWIGTGDHLLRTVSIGYWPVAGVDLALLTVAVTAFLAARALKHRSPTSTSVVGIGAGHA